MAALATGMTQRLRAAGRLLRTAWDWARGGYYFRGPGRRRRHREWLWPLARFTALLPISFKKCECRDGLSVGVPASRSEDVDTAPPLWDASRPGTYKNCTCPVATRSIPWLAYSFTVAALLVPSSVYALHTDRQNAAAGRPTLRMSTRTDELVTFCDILSVSGCSTICFLQVAFTRGALFMVLDQLQQVDRLLSMRPPAVPGLLAVWLALLLVVVFMDGSMWSEMSEGIEYAATYFPFYLIYIMTFMMEVLFIDEAYSIYMRFLALNEKLDQALSLPSYQAATEQLHVSPLDGGWIGAAPRSHTVSIATLSDSSLYGAKTGIANGRRPRLRPGAFGAVTPVTGQQSPAPSIQRLNMAHHLLCEASTSVAKRYGLCLLADMLCILLHLVITAYFFLKQLMAANPTATSQYILMQFVWLIVHMVRLFAIVMPCSRASVEASRTGALVGVVLSTTAPSTLVHKQLETFSIQLLHHKVNFNACGLFELGLPLVVSILGAVTTYLVVLLQLKGSPMAHPQNVTAPAP